MSIRLFWCNVLCVLIAASAVWANYHVVEQTRVLNVALDQTDRQIRSEQADFKDAQVTYVALSRPGRIQALAEALLGMDDGAAYQVASFQMVPMRSADEEQEISADPADTDAGVVKISASEGDR